MTATVNNEEAILEAASVPAEFKCRLCKKVMRDAVIISCCRTSFCDECIISSLTSEGPKRMICPSCNAQAFPDNLQPFDALRTRIAKFLRDLAQRKITDSRTSTAPPIAPTTVSIKAAPSSLESRITIRSDKRSMATALAVHEGALQRPPSSASNYSQMPARVAEGLTDIRDLIRKRQLDDGGPPPKKASL